MGCNFCDSNVHHSVVILSLPPLTIGELREVLITLEFTVFLQRFSIPVFGEKFSVHSRISLLWKLLYCLTCRYIRFCNFFGVEKGKVNSWETRKCHLRSQ